MNHFPHLHLMGVDGGNRSIYPVTLRSFIIVVLTCSRKNCLPNGILSYGHIKHDYRKLMSNENKPESVADPVDTEATSEAEALSQRIAEGREAQKADIIEDIMSKKDEKAVVTPGGTADVATQEGTSIVESNADSAALKLIEASTGRKFDNVEDAKKYLENLNKLVGDQSVAKARDAEKVLTGLTQKFGKNSAELEKFIADALTEKPVDAPKEAPKVQPKAVTDDAVTKRIEHLEHANQLLALEKKYPNAASVADEVAIIAKFKGVDYIKAFEDSPLKSLVELKAKEEHTKNPIVAPSTRTNIDYRKAQELGQKVLEGRATDLEQQELVKIALGMK